MPSGAVPTTEAACREAIASGDRSAWVHLVALLAAQGDREEEVEAACREAIAAGGDTAWLALGNVLAAQLGREEEAEAAYRTAIAAGQDNGWLGVGNVLLQRGREKEAEAAYRSAIESVALDPREREAARQGEVSARRTRFMRRAKYALAVLAVIAFVVNLVLHNDNSEAWAVLSNVNGVVFWFAVFAFPVALLVERAQVGGVRRAQLHRRRARRRTRRPAASRRAIPGRRRVPGATAPLRRLGERLRRFETQLERLFPTLYDARHAAKGLGRVVWPLIGPLLAALVVAPILALLAALVGALGLEAPAIDLPSIDLPSVDVPDIPDPNIRAPEWLRAVGDVIAVLTKYLPAAALAIYGIRQTIKARRKRMTAEQLGRRELLQRLTIALSNVEATARAGGTNTAPVGSIVHQGPRATHRSRKRSRASSQARAWGPLLKRSRP